MSITLAATKTFPERVMSKKDRLKEIIIEKSLKIAPEEENILFSLVGAKADYLFDLKTTMLDPEGANLS